jgi:hypothetical protein
MSTQQRYTRLALWAAVLTLLGSLPAGPWAQGGRPAGKPSGTYPRYLLVIRHAEKPADDSDPNLTSRGAARAAALPSLFLIPPTFPTKPAPFPTPDFLFATKKSPKSNRPVETVQPLAKALGDMPIHQKHADNKFQAVVDDIFGDAKYASKAVLICWHHGKIPDLAQAIAAKAKNGDKLKGQIPKRWDGTVFDRVWQFTFDDQGQATFADSPQQLLFGDRAKE